MHNTSGSRCSTQTRSDWSVYWLLDCSLEFRRILVHCYKSINSTRRRCALLPLLLLRRTTARGLPVQRRDPIISGPSASINCKIAAHLPLSLFSSPTMFSALSVSHCLIFWDGFCFVDAHAFSPIHSRLSRLYLRFVGISIVENSFFLSIEKIRPHYSQSPFASWDWSLVFLVPVDTTFVITLY